VERLLQDRQAPVNAATVSNLLDKLSKLPLMERFPQARIASFSTAQDESALGLLLLIGLAVSKLVSCIVITVYPGKNF
jgi:hypothetical protein